MGIVKDLELQAFENWYSGTIPRNLMTSEEYAEHLEREREYEMEYRLNENLAYDTACTSRSQMITASEPWWAQ